MGFGLLVGKHCAEDMGFDGIEQFESGRVVGGERIATLDKMDRGPLFLRGLGESEHAGFEVASLWTIERWTRLEHPERGLREWLEMFAGSLFEEVPAEKREALIAQIEWRLRPTLHFDGAWWIDYRRLRVVGERLPMTLPEMLVRTSWVGVTEYVVSAGAEAAAAALRSEGATVLEVLPMNLSEIFLVLVGKENAHVPVEVLA